MPCAIANSSAKSRARSLLREPTATTCDAVPTATASAKVCAMPPGAMMPQRMAGASWGSGVRGCRQLERHIDR